LTVRTSFFFLGKRFILVNSYVRYFSCYVRYPRRNKLFDSRRTMRTSNRLQPRQTADSCQVTVFHVCSLRSAIGTSQAHNHKPPTTVTQPCRPSPPTSTEDHSQRHKDPLHLLAHPKVHRLRSLWHAADRESEGSLVMRTPSRRKTCASGTYQGGGAYTQVMQYIISNQSHIFFHAVATTASSRSTRLSTSKSDGSSCARWALERTAS
jgi:hypothetical protein